MFSRESKQATRIDTLVGKGTSIKGDIEFTGGLHLDGRIIGNVRADPASSSSLSVSEHGCIEGTVDVPNVVMNGTVKGDIRARTRVVLGAQARIQGNVYYGVIEMALGAEITGKLVSMATETGAGAGEAGHVPESRPA